jgi:hypothetical protein
LASALFDPGREGFLKGEIRWDGTAVIKVALVRGYTFNAAHKFVSDVTATGTLAATSAALTSQAATNGVADAGDVTFTAVASSASNHYLLVFQASAVTGGGDVAASAQRLIAYIDTGTNLPVVPNGGDVTISWDNGGNKIFKL